LKFEHQTDFAVASFLTLTGGIETEKEQASSNFKSVSSFGPFTDNLDPHSARTNGYYAQARVTALDAFFSTFGVRVDDHSQFGAKTTWRVAPGYRIDSTGTKLSASVGTGYKAPSLFQLYSSFGRPDLSPEKSKGVDAGIEQALLGDKLTVGATYFWNQFDNLIDFNPDTFIFENIAKARTDGIEATVSYAFTKQLKAGLSYTYTDTENRVTHESLLRRPRNKASADVWYEVNDRLSFDVNGLFVGKRFDNDFSTFPATRTSLGSYVIVNLAVEYKITPQAAIYARVDNLFDREYEEVLGFGTPGVSAFGGIKVNFAA
jgi:vitamin B12 transporter